MRRKEEVTRETIIIAVLYAILGFLGIYGLVDWIG